MVVAVIYPAYADWMAKRMRVASLLGNLKDAINGCGDGNCLIRKPVGMHTNGGCKCLAQIADEALELAAAADSIKHIRGIPLPSPGDRKA